MSKDCQIKEFVYPEESIFSDVLNGGIYYIKTRGHKSFSVMLKPKHETVDVALILAEYENEPLRITSEETINCSSVDELKLTVPDGLKCVYKLIYE